MCIDYIVVQKSYRKSIPLRALLSVWLAKTSSIASQTISNIFRPLCYFLAFPLATLMHSYSVYICIRINVYIYI